jgi:hypothetical protein
MWVDTASVRYVAASAIADARAVHAEALACPVCRAAMGAWHARGIVIDRCDLHGVWFDRTELDHLVAASRAIDRLPTSTSGGEGVGLGTVAMVAGGAAIAGGVAMAMAPEPQRDPVGAVIDGADVGIAGLDVAQGVAPLAEPAIEAAGGVVEAGVEIASGGAEVVEAAGGVVELLGDAIGAVFSIFS